MNHEGHEGHEVCSTARSSLEPRGAVDWAYGAEMFDGEAVIRSHWMVECASGAEGSSLFVFFVSFVVHFS